jgi:integrase
MRPLSINVTKRTRRRKLRSGASIVQERWVLNFKEPRSGTRRQLFFERKAEAIARRDQLIDAYRMGTLSIAAERSSITVALAIERWLTNRRPNVSARSIRGYVEACRNITGPLIRGNSRERAVHSWALRSPNPPKAVEHVPVLGHIRVEDLTTAMIRTWHSDISSEVGKYSANRALMFLKSALALAAEDFEFRPPAMPSNLGRARSKQRKEILTTEQVAILLGAAREDAERGIYYAFPFLTGVRPSEQLGLLWSEVDFEAGVIRICRAQSDGGVLLEVTKTEAGRREIPMCPMLRRMLLEWRVRCPRLTGDLYRVFPAPGRVQAWPKPRLPGGGALLYENFRKRHWRPTFARLGIPYVTPHSARHLFISALQMAGIEVGLVAKLAGHSNPTVTLGHYTQAVRGGHEAISLLERTYLGAAAVSHGGQHG